jgi:outer membrane protein W
MTRALVLALLIGIAGSAHAGDFGHSGPYVGLGGAFATDLFEDDLDDAVEDAVGSSVDLDVDEGWGVGAVLGYRMLPILAAELQYEYVDSFGIDAASLSVSDLDVRGHVTTVNLKLVLPTWRIQPYLLVGVGAALYTASGELLGTDLLADDEWTFAGRVGGGIDLYITKRVLLNVGATTVLTTNEVSTDITGEDIGALNYVAVQAGLQFRF